MPTFASSSGAADAAKSSWRETVYDAAVPKLTLDELETLRLQVFPDAKSFASLVSLADRELVMRMPFRKELTRAGGTISGPALMALADSVVYWLILAHAGPIIEAATANLDIAFLSRPDPADILATARLLRLGRRLAVATVELRSDGRPDVVAHATVTYALPPTPPR